MGAAVILIAMVVTHDGHRHRRRSHLHVTVRDIEADDEMRIGVFKHILRQIHERGSHNSASGCLIRCSSYEMDSRLRVVR